MAYQAKRQFNRKTSREAVKLLSSRGVEYAVFEDISAGGLRILMEHKVELGTKFRAEFLLPYTGTGRYQGMEVEVEAVRCEPHKDGYDVGVKFSNLDSARRSQMETSIDCTPGEF